jgi:hypothetical protein
MNRVQFLKQVLGEYLIDDLALMAINYLDFGKYVVLPFLPTMFP